MDQVSIIGITSYPESEFGRLIRSEFEGDKVIINLKGKTKDDKSEECSDRFIESGIMGDQFELGVLSLCQRIAEQMHLNCGIENIDYSKFPGKIKYETNENFDEIEWEVSNIIESEDYWSIIDKITSRSSVIFVGVRYSSMVGSIAAIRLMHLKRVLGDEIFVYQRENTPKTRFGDLAIVISSSGGAEGILSSVSKLEKLGTEVLAITGSRDSKLASIADYTFILEEEPSKEKISPIFSKKAMSSFYEKAFYLLSVMPIHAREELKKRGYNITEEMMKTMHGDD